MTDLTPEKLALKRATGEMIAGVGGLEAAAGFCRVGKSKLSENQSINCPESFAAVDVVADLEPLARNRPGWPHVTRFLCQQMGGAFVALPSAANAGGDIHAAAGVHAKEASDVTARLLAAAAQGPMTREIVQRNELVREAREAVEASVQLLALIEAIAGGE